jgi:hypothetical protein
MALTAEQGFLIREQYSTTKEKEVCDRHNLTQIGGSRTKVDGQNDSEKASIKNASGSSTQVHLTTQNKFCSMMNLNKDCVEFIQLFCGSKLVNNNGKDRYTIKQIDEQYIDAFRLFLNTHKTEIIDLIVSNGFGINRVIYNDIKNNVEYDLTYEDLIAKIDKCEWKFLSGGIHLKDANGKTYFHMQREGKKNPSNRYNVLWHIHKNLFK